MRMNKAKITCLVLALFFISFNVLGLQSNSTITEDFESYSLSKNIASLSNLTYNVYIYPDVLSRSDGLYDIYLIRYNASALINATLNISDFWGLGTKQLKNTIKNTDSWAILLFVFNTDISIINNSVNISIYANISGNGHPNNQGGRTDILFKDKNGDCKFFLLDSFGGSSNVHTFVHDVLCNGNGIAPYSLTPSNFTHLQRIDFNWSSRLIDNGKIIKGDFSRLDNIKYMYLILNNDLGITAFHDIENIKLINILSGINILPTANITLGDTCFNNTGEIKSVSFNISVYDPEGDSVLYNPVTNIVSNYMEKQSIYYQSNQLEVFDQDYSFYDNTIKVDQGCEFNLLPWFNQSKFNLQAHYSTENSVLARDPNMLRLSSGCSGRAEYMYQLKQPFGWFHYDTVIYDMLDVLEAINLTFYDSSFQKVSAFRFKVNNATSIGIYIYNGTDYVYNKSTSIIDYFPIIYEDSGVNNATIMFPGNAISNYKLLTNDIEYVSITIENGAVFQEYFNYFGNYNTLNYSSSALTGTINVQYGENIIDYYITDNIHNPEYRKVTVIKKYNLCKYDNFTTTTDPSFPAPDPNTIDPVYYIRTTLGVNLANYLIAMNLYEVGKNAIFMIFIFELFTMIIAGFITFQTLNITVPLFLSSFSGLILCLMVGYNYESLVFAIFLAIALSLMFSKAMVKGDSDA